MPTFAVKMGNGKWEEVRAESMDALFDRQFKQPVVMMQIVNEDLNHIMFKVISLNGKYKKVRLPG